MQPGESGSFSGPPQLSPHAEEDEESGRGFGGIRALGKVVWCEGCGWSSSVGEEVGIDDVEIESVCVDADEEEDAELDDVGGVVAVVVVVVVVVVEAPIRVHCKL